VVHDAHLFILQLHASREKWHCVGKLSTGLGSKISQSLILIDALSSLSYNYGALETDLNISSVFTSA
jgi:hypothetical protein